MFEHQDEFMRYRFKSVDAVKAFITCAKKGEKFCYFEGDISFSSFIDRVYKGDHKKPANQLAVYLLELQGDKKISFTQVRTPSRYSNLAAQHWQYYIQVLGRGLHDAR